MREQDEIRRDRERKDYEQGKKKSRELTYCPSCGAHLPKPAGKRKCMFCFWEGKCD